MCGEWWDELRTRWDEVLKRANQRDLKHGHPTKPGQNLAAMACMQENGALVERCFAEGMTTRLTPKGDSAFREFSEAS
jgi:hypothetical protein